MQYGWTGTNLEVDLTHGTIQKVKGDPNLVRDYLGGKGINARILWERVPPEVGAFSEDNLLIISAGLLCGTPVPAANRTIITHKSPVTDMHSYSVMGGFFAPELKHAGYDTIIIRGKSSIPVYLWINNEKVELRDASHLWGKSTHQTRDLIQKELKNDLVQIACIGVAGENRAYAASVEHNAGSSASRGGVGAIWGDKKLKAIAVYGTQDVSVANPTRLGELCNQALSRANEVRIRRKQRSRRVGGATIPPGNFEMPTEADEKTEIMQKLGRIEEIFKDTLNGRIREVNCHNCMAGSRWTFHGEGNVIPAVKCAAMGQAVKSVKIVDPDFGLKISTLYEEYGVDAMAAMQEIAFAIDLYEKGILTKEDTGGMHLEFGNAEVAFWLLDKIVRREGIGDILADGVYRAAQRIGKGAEKYAHHANKQEPFAFDVRGRIKYLLEQTINDRFWDVSRLESMITHTFFDLTKAQREKEVKAGLFHFPKEFDKFLVADKFDLEADDDFTNEAYVQIVAYNEEVYTLNDLDGICYFWGGWGAGSSPFRSRAMVADVISSSTGLDIDEAEATKIANRTIALVRAYNVREGAKRDRVDDMYFQKDSRPPFIKPNRDQVERWIDRFYELRGRTKEGIPTRESLIDLGLDDVWQELERRGILTASDIAVSAT